MKNVTVITGPRFSGKTTLLEMIAKGRNFVDLSLEDLAGRNQYSKVRPETEVIIIDDCSFDKGKQLAALKALCTAEKIMIRQPFQRQPISIDRPEIVIASNVSGPEFFARKNIRHIKLK